MKRTEIKRRPLADTTLAKLEPEAKEYRTLDGDGLYLRVKPDGQKSWQLRYKTPAGKWSWLGLGAYPAVSGSQARRKAAQLRNDAADGQNPIVTKRARQASEVEASTQTFEALAREWLASRVNSWNSDTHARVRSALENHVFPTMGTRAFEKITPIEWMELLKTMERLGIHEQMSRVRSYCRDAYNLARVTGRATHNPLEGLTKFLATPKGTNYAHVSLTELPDLLRAMRSYPHAKDVRIGLCLLPLLAVRPSELREAQWEEFDFETNLWTVPEDRKGRKRGREFLVPLPRQAITLLKELHSLTGGYPQLFPGRGDRTKSRSDTVFLMALRRLGYEGRQTGHGFRHIASTILNEHGYPPDHIEAQLSHKVKGTRGVYNKAQYLEHRRTMMQWYADYLDELAAGKVIPGRFTKAV